MIEQTINPILIQTPILSIHWYGLLATTGIIIAAILFKKLTPTNIIPEKKQTKYITITTITVILGARLLSILSNLPYYIENPLKTLTIWEGGLAFHGGLIAGLITILILTKKDKLNKKQILNILDTITIAVLPTIILGRIGNFINSEFYGKITTLPWGIIFPEITAPRHPVQIYESITYLIIFLIMWKLKNKTLKKGTIFITTITLYGITRFLLEYLKDPQAITHIGPLTWGQAWSLPMIIIGITLLTKLKNKKINKPQNQKKT